MSDMINDRPDWQPVNFLTETDLTWAGRASDTSNKFNNYYDYYFSGEDIRVYIDGLFDPQDELDIASFEFVIAQEKQPLYGFWSYNHDAVLLGTRLVSGSFGIYTRHPRRMTELLEKAAKNRAFSGKNKGTRGYDSSSYNSIVSKLTPGTFNSDDEKNIEKYWAYSKLDRVTNDSSTSQSNIFSAHPPFNFVIVYGAEETAITPFAASLSPDIEIEDNLDRMIYSDINQRTLRVDDIGSGMKIILQQVNLVNVSVMYAPGGTAVGERYSFIARDFYHSSTDLSFVRNLVATNESESSVQNDNTSSGSSTWVEGNTTRPGTIGLGNPTPI